MALFALSILILSIGCFLSGVNFANDALGRQGIAHIHRALNADPQHYIVMLEDSCPATQVSAEAQALTEKYGGKIQYVYDTVAKGFAITGIQELQAEALSRDPE
jgi:hypothetical protein